MCRVRHYVKTVIKRKRGWLYTTMLSVCLSFRLSVRLFVCRLKRVSKLTRFSQTVSNVQLWSLLTTDKKSYMGLSKNTFLDPYNDVAKLAVCPTAHENTVFSNPKQFRTIVWPTPNPIKITPPRVKFMLAAGLTHGRNFIQTPWVIPRPWCLCITPNTYTAKGDYCGSVNQDCITKPIIDTRLQ